MSRSIDLNADLGEGMPWDLEVLGLVTSANVSCGVHAGELRAIEATLIRAGDLGVAVGAHPSWPDREGFGRVERSATAEEVAGLVHDQVFWLEVLGMPRNVPVRYVKPHGALYNQAMRDEPPSLAIADGLIAGMVQLGVGRPLMGQPGTRLERLAIEAGFRYVREGFPDRRYRDDGRLVPRAEPGALIEGVGAVVEQALWLADRGFESLCLHGDSPEAVARAGAIRDALDRAGVAVRSFLVS